MNRERPWKRKVLLAIQTREVRTGLFLALAAEPSLQLIGTAGSASELLTYARALQPDGVVLEWALLDHNAAESYTNLIQIVGSERIFIICKPSSEMQAKTTACVGSSFSDPEHLLEALKSLSPLR